MSDAPDWVDPVMRTGYAARGVVYALLGGLTMSAAWSGGEAEGTKGALETLRGSTGGVALLWIIAAGLICYGIWRLIAAWYDLERRGDDEEGMAKRAGLVVTGIIHFFMGVAVAGIAQGTGGGGGSGAQDWTAQVLQMPGGRWLVGIAALGFAGAGVHYIIKGYKKKYERYIESSEASRKLEPMLRFGFLAYGIVLIVVGAFLMVAAVQADPQEAKGMAAALEYIRDLPAGWIWLLLIGFGFIGFALENLIEARYRIIPRISDGDTEVLAGKLAEI